MRSRAPAAAESAGEGLSQRGLSRPRSLPGSLERSTLSPLTGEALGFAERCVGGAAACREVSEPDGRVSGCQDA